MRVVAPDRRPPVPAWGFAGLALLPLIVAWAGYRYGWGGPLLDLGALWGLVLLGIFAGMIGASGALRGRWMPAYLALLAAMVPLMALWTGMMDLPQTVAAGLVLILVLDLWAARAGLMPEWWPRLKLGFTVVAGVLLLAPLIG